MLLTTFEEEEEEEIEYGCSIHFASCFKNSDGHSEFYETESNIHKTSKRLFIVSDKNPSLQLECEITWILQLSSQPKKYMQKSAS